MSDIIEISNKPTPPVPRLVFAEEVYAAQKEKRSSREKKSSERESYQSSERRLVLPHSGDSVPVNHVDHSWMLIFSFIGAEEKGLRR